MGKSGRPLLVHYHVYKNAGTSVEKNLSDSFGHQWAVCEGDRENILLSNDDVAAFAKANPHIRAISSHKARPFPLLKRVCPILFLRHPIDRARSIYYFTKRDPTQVGHSLARDGSFKDYVNWWLDLPHSALRNYQVVHLSRASFRSADASQAVASSEDLSEVRDLLRSLRFFGLVRRFEESCRGFEACYARTFPGLRMRPVRANASTNEMLSESEALNIARDELGEATYARLAEANRFDLALYETAVELFDQNLAQLAERRLGRAAQVLGDLVQGIRAARPRPALILTRRRAN